SLGSHTPLIALMVISSVRARRKQKGPRPWWSRASRVRQTRGGLGYGPPPRARATAVAGRPGRDPSRLLPLARFNRKTMGGIVDTRRRRLTSSSAPAAARHHPEERRRQARIERVADAVAEEVERQHR